ncbi:N-acetylglucosaminyl deacetylase, LmbE family [Deinococcus reticulitermitis]|uniref:N-acetylglucosaminyl deacetylase, LmbE family n=1 Tax=Deinococcus reticulitermitis TaxID=856736 RepID=A0A1H7AL91_9DEIO|nr:PIG-L deacetylase family protein [Deinococcus reticulitermitis]SEJ66138.1 N-acetylglucosaminyl deacetylase, LmbE family [Deinococcus reticulitermitis]
MPRLTRRPRRSRARWLPLAGGVLAALLAAWINSPLVDRVVGAEGARVAALPSAPPFQAGERVLVLAPHPDDETLCCAGMMQRARAAGAKVYVAWATAGDGFELDAAVTERVVRPRGQALRDLGKLRAAEARRAAALLGMPPGHTFMLGYPDGGLFRLFTTSYAQPYTSPRTGADAVYVPGALTPGVGSTGRALEADLGRVLDRVRPDLVLAPAPQDFHPDHRTLSYLAMRLMSGRGQEGRLRYWVVHGGLEWPLPKGLHPAEPLTPPPLARHLPWARVDLTPAQVARKRLAVDSYRTQTRLLGRFMHAFVRRNELLSPQPSDDSPREQGTGP